MKDRNLRTYLNDHRAGAEAGLQLAKDSRDHNPTGPLHEFLSALVTEIEEDVEQLERLHGRLHSAENPLKKTSAWLFSKVSRLKLETALLEYSDLTRLEELEALMLGVRGKLALWNVLEAACGPDPRFEHVDFDELQRRAQRQLEGLKKHHLEAARHAFNEDVEAV
ncbi:MAG: hypothetical protein ACLFTE_08485 [Salinivenus sp.]